MGEYLSLLVTLSDGDYLIKVGIKIKRGIVKDDTFEYWNEPESRKEIYKLLPQRAQAYGDIVDVDVLLDIISYA